MSALFFIITATTFDSLGLVLPAMVAELGWSWTQAGLGYTLLGVFCGITATVPACLIRRSACAPPAGRRAGDGAGFPVAWPARIAWRSISSARRWRGWASPCWTTVPGTYLLARLFARPSFAIGLYFTVGGLGAVFAPLLYCGVMQVTGAWRDYWLVAGAARGRWSRRGGAAGGYQHRCQRARRKPIPTSPRESWAAAAALKTPQFWILAAAYSAFLFCGITANSVSVAHLTQHGVARGRGRRHDRRQRLINAAARGWPAAADPLHQCPHSADDLAGDR